MNIVELEKLRLKARNSVIIGIVVSIIIGIVSFVMMNNLFLIFISFIFGVGLTMIITSKTRKNFSLAFKNTFVLNSLQSIFTELNYQPEMGISEQLIRSTQMMNMGDRYSSNDFIAAKYKNISVIQSDVHIEEKRETRDSDGHTRTTWVTIFKGRWMVFDFNKVFKANIQVSQKGFGNSKINNWFVETKYKKVMMEDQVFNDMFRTYAQSEHEAFYILTPALMEKIKQLVSNIQGKVLFCFIDNKLHVGIQNNKDSFEHSIFKKIDETKIMEQISKDIKLITNFVDELDLDNDLFKK